MLPARLLAYSLCGRQLVPRYLTPRDEPWIRELLGELDGLVGRTAREVDEAFGGRIAASSTFRGVASKTVAGVWHVGRKIWQTSCTAAVRPSRIRSVVFELAIRTGGDRKKSSRGFP